VTLYFISNREGGGYLWSRRRGMGTSIAFRATAVGLEVELDDNPCSSAGAEVDAGGREIGARRRVAEVEMTWRKSSFNGTRSGTARLAGSWTTSLHVFELITWSSEQLRQFRAGCGACGAQCFVGTEEVHVRRSSFYERSFG
jgi:hypothetical protein